MASTSFRHSTAGSCERQVQTLKRYLAKHINEDLTNWDEHLAAARFAHDITVNDATGTSPFILMHGRQPVLSLDTALIKPDNINYTAELEIDSLINKVQMLENITYDNIKHAQDIMKKSYDKHCTPLKFAPGMKAWLYVYKLSRKFNHKMSPRYIGPFLITKQEGYNFYLRNLTDNIDLKVPVHSDRLQLFITNRISPPLPLIKPIKMSDDLENQIAQDVENMSLDIDDVTDNKIQTTTTNEQISDIKELPRVNDTHIEADRAVHSIPKGRIVQGTKFYYIIYSNQDNLNIGQFICESDLTQTEKEYIRLHESEIRMLRHTPKVPKDICAIMQ
jgi:hypothetical protein